MSSYTSKLREFLELYKNLDDNTVDWVISEVEKDLVSSGREAVSDRRLRLIIKEVTTTKQYQEMSADIFNDFNVDSTIYLRNKESICDQAIADIDKILAFSPEDTPKLNTANNN